MSLRISVAPVVAALREGGAEPKLVHTGQHYDEAMSKAFFKDLDLLRPNINLGIGSGSQAEQTAKVLMAYEQHLLQSPTDLAAVVGDVNSTLAAVLAAAKLHTPVAHIEAGLRSRDWTMPEGINRVLTDLLSHWLLTPSEDAGDNLLARGIEHSRVHLVRNVMIDTLLRLLPAARSSSSRLLNELGIERDSYAVMTRHRPSNVDRKADLARSFEAAARVSEILPIVFPVHPRTRKQLAASGLPRHQSRRRHRTGGCGTRSMRSAGGRASPAAIPLWHGHAAERVVKALLSAWESGLRLAATRRVCEPCRRKSGICRPPARRRSLSSWLACRRPRRRRAAGAALASGQSYVEDISDSEVKAAVEAGFVPTTDPSVISTADAILITVPTPLTSHLPDLSFVEAAGKTVGDHVRSGQLVVLESTSYPGTTEEFLGPILEHRSGLEMGSDFYLAFSPERIDSGNPTFGLRNTPKVIGGVSEASTKAAAALYEQICDTIVEVSGTREAEMAKLIENTYRHVNIAFVNEMTIFSKKMGIDLWEALRAAATKPFGYEPFYPGPGIGGHCIPIDPNYLSMKVRDLGYTFWFVELAREVNGRMPSYGVDQAVKLLNGFGRAMNTSSVLVLGVAYKPNVSDTRETPAREVAGRLLGLGAAVAYANPHVSSFVVKERPLRRVDGPVAAVEEFDLYIVHIPHDRFDLTALAATGVPVLDTSGRMTGDHVERL